jgi:hypothetical protein
LAKLGVWGFHHGNQAYGFGTPSGFWEIFFRVPVTESSLYMVHAGAAEETVLTRTYSATDLTSTGRNNNARYWKMGCLAPRKLKELSTTGEHAFHSSVAKQHPDGAATDRPPYSAPTSSELAAFLVGRFTHALRSRAEELLKLPQWILLSKFAEDFPPRIGGFRTILPPKDRFWADPHIVHRDGKYYVFVEELFFRQQKGHISVLIMDERGNREAPIKVLERDYHLSYPSVFEAAGDLYMIPESADNRTVELYRCVEFPGRWEWVANLLEDIVAFDATVVQHGGKWWLFANVIEEPGISSWDELFLFHSDALVGAEWVPHRLNPIVTDVRRARPAGAIIERDGHLYRPSQDCSVRYGYAVKINRITKLSEDDYEESEVLSIPPDALDDVIAAHTYARAGRLTVLDALRPRWKF